LTRVGDEQADAPGKRLTRFGVNSATAQRDTDRELVPEPAPFVIVVDSDQRDDLGFEAARENTFVGLVPTTQKREVESPPRNEFAALE